MLPESDRQLLTAYVDGELSARQRRAALGLLRRSAEARTLLRQLQDDARRLRHLPRRRLDQDFSDRLLQTIAQRGLRPSRRSRQRTPALPVWAVLAAAASVLIAVGASTFLSLLGALSSRDGKPASAQVKRANEAEAPRKPGEGEKSAPAAEPRAVAKRGPDEAAPGRAKGQGAPGPGAVAKGELPERGTPLPPERRPEDRQAGPIAAAPAMERIRPTEILVALPSLFNLRSLMKPEPRKKLVEELGRHDAFYAELLCREGTPAFAKVQAALKTAGLDLVIDPGARLGLKSPRWKVNYLFYLEDLTAQELARMLQRLAQDDFEADRKKIGTGHFSSPDANLIFCPMTEEHRRKLVLYLGADPRAERSTGPLGTPLHRPLAEQTADQVVGALAARGGRASAGAPAGKEKARLALAMAHGPVPRRQSPEVKRFLDGRRPPRPGTLQVFLVLRGMP